MRPLAINFSEEAIALFDEIAEALSERSYGMRVTRSDAIRIATMRGARIIEQELDHPDERPGLAEEIAVASRPQDRDEPGAEASRR